MRVFSSKRMVGLPAAVFWLVVGGAAWAGDGAGKEHGPVRLLERLEGAKVESPLLGTGTARALLEDGGSGLERTTVFREDFERFSFRRAGWPVDSDGRVLARPGGGEGGKAFRYRGGHPHRYLFLVPAEPERFYLVRRSIRTSDPLVDFKIVESRLRLRRPERRNHPADRRRALRGTFVPMKELVRVHRFDQAAKQDTWQTDDRLVYTSPSTRSLVLIVNDALATIARHEVESWFDDLQVERLEPDRPQELVLSKALAPAPGADPARGLAKHGQLLPAGEVEGAKAPRDANFGYRQAVFAPAPTRIAYQLEVPPRGVLWFSCGLLKVTRPPDEAELRVRVRPAQGAERVVFEKKLAIDAGGAGWHWHEERVPLDGYGGQEVILTIETRAPEGARGYALWGDPVIETPRRAGDQPNVVLVAVDTLRADRLSCQGYRRETSPVIDALAAEGIQFSQAVSPCNWTSPAFGAMFSGLPPSRNHVIHRARALPDGIETLAERFRAAGYHTHGIAYKTYIYNMGFEQGFGTWFNLPALDKTADDNLAKALAWLQRNHERRFFLFMHFNDPHQPFNQPPPFDRKFNRAEDLRRLGIELPLIVTPESKFFGCRRCRLQGDVRPAARDVAHDLYDGEIAYVDDRLGKLLAALDERGIGDHTVIAFTSDHGELLWEHDGYFGHAGPYMHDELIHVPLIIRPAASGDWARGRRIDAQVRMHDVVPTLLEMAGIPTGAADMDARSLVPLMRTGAGSEGLEDRPAFSENPKEHVLGLRHDGWKYVLGHRRGRPVVESLYHLESDPQERKDLAGSRPEVLAPMRHRVLDYYARNRPGHYLVVTVGEPGRAVRVGLVSDRRLHAATSVYGLPLRRRGGNRKLVFGGRARGPVVLFARLSVPEDAQLRIEVKGAGGAGGDGDELVRQAVPGDFDAPVPGAILQAAASGNTQVLLLRGPPRF